MEIQMDKALTERIDPRSDLSDARSDMSNQSEFFPWALVFILVIEFAAAIYLGGVR